MTGLQRLPIASGESANALAVPGRQTLLQPLSAGIIAASPHLTHRANGSSLLVLSIEAFADGAPWSGTFLPPSCLSGLSISLSMSFS